VSERPVALCLPSLCLLGQRQVAPRRDAGQHRCASCARKLARLARGGADVAALTPLAPSCRSERWLPLLPRGVRCCSDAPPGGVARSRLRAGAGRDAARRRARRAAPARVERRRSRRGAARAARALRLSRAPRQRRCRLCVRRADRRRDGAEPESTRGVAFRWCDTHQNADAALAVTLSTAHTHTRLPCRTQRRCAPRIPTRLPAGAWHPRWPSAATLRSATTSATMPCRSSSASKPRRRPAQPAHAPWRRRCWRRCRRRKQSQPQGTHAHAHAHTRITTRLHAALRPRPRAHARLLT
jgi:hypothetical protein